MMDKIDFKEDRGSSFYHLLLTAVTKQFTKKENDEFMKHWHSKPDHEMCLLVDDKYKFSIKKIMEEWDKQVDRMIEKRALALLEEKCGDLLNAVHEVTEDIEYKLKELLEK
jgi:hypothetical protein